MISVWKTNGSVDEAFPSAFLTASFKKTGKSKNANVKPGCFKVNNRYDRRGFNGSFSFVSLSFKDL